MRGAVLARRARRLGVQHVARLVYHRVDVALAALGKVPEEITLFKFGKLWVESLSVFTCSPVRRSTPPWAWICGRRSDRRR